MLIENKTIINGYCIECGGYGLNKGCPTCGKKKGVFNLTQEPEKMKKVEEKADKILIPKNYIGIQWKKEELLNDNEKRVFYNIEKNIILQSWVNKLEKIHKIYEKGNIPNKSYFISAPANFSKITFSYSCMQIALAHNYKVAPLLNTMEVKRILTLGSETGQLKIGNIFYEDYLNAEVAFITVSKIYLKNKAYDIIQELLDIRSRNNLTTIILSRYPLETLTKGLTTADVSSMITRYSKDSYKRPELIEYSDRIYEQNLKIQYDRKINEQFKERERK